MKRIAVGFFWTLMLMWAGNYVALFTGTSQVAPAMVAVAVGAFVAADPLHRIWPRSSAKPTAVPALQAAAVEGLTRP